MKKNYIHTSEFFYGNKISNYGLQNGCIDYLTLSKAFDCVMVNDITKLFYGSIYNECIDFEVVNGNIDNTEAIEELEAKRDAFEDIMDTLNNIEVDDIIDDAVDTIYNLADDAIQNINSAIYDLEDENLPEVYQYYIISESGAKILEEFTDEIVYYIPYLDMHIWGVTHFGTAWDYVLTDIRVEVKREV